jgi:hypothetical protein
MGAKHAPFDFLMCVPSLSWQIIVFRMETQSKVLVSQGLDSEISRRFPPAFALAYSTATPNDTFIMVPRGKRRVFPVFLLLYPEPVLAKELLS